MTAPQPTTTTISRIGIGLPAAVPGVEATTIATWAAEAEQAGFASVGVIDRLVYDNLEPLTALAAAAARTTHVELLTTVLNVGWRANPVLLAKQLASVDLLSGGRLTAGLGLGGWPEDFAASDVPTSGAGARLRSTLATMHQVWNGDVHGQGGPTTRLPAGRPTLLFGGLVPAAHRRAATEGQGWVAPLMNRSLLTDGAAAVRGFWAAAGREGEPRIATGRYFCLGSGADDAAAEYLRHYYGDASTIALADTLTTPERIADEIAWLDAAGVTDLVLYPCSPALAQVDLLAAALPSRPATTRAA
jgi:alkanesulfonate monooxygenase SsuD/methylene tetrahydromethanopterin reductase-like flavin-dependent oxidoreductase (luciferase family)